MNEIKVGVLGPEGTNGHFAFKTFVGRFPAILSSAIPTFCSSHNEIVEGIGNGILSYGVLPIENSTTGLIRDVIELWLERRDPLCVLAEQWIGIHHCIIGHPGTEKAARIISHPEAYAQCRNRLKELPLLDGAVVQPALSTAEAAALVSGGKMLAGYETVALASEFAAQLHKLVVLEPGVNDNLLNSTRFHLVARAGAGIPEQRHDKSAIIFGLKNESAALALVLDVFRVTGADMSSIHSIAMGPPGDFMFYIEFDIPIGAEDHIFPILGTVTKDLHILGYFQEYPETEFV